MSNWHPFPSGSTSCPCGAPKTDPIHRAPTHESLKAVWLDMMGGPQVLIDVLVDPDRRRVLVTQDTLYRMVGSLVLFGPLDDDNNAATARALHSEAVSVDGLWDVTDMPSWNHWLDLLIDPDTGAAGMRDVLR